MFLALTLNKEWTIVSSPDCYVQWWKTSGYLWPAFLCSDIYSLNFVMSNLIVQFINWSRDTSRWSESGDSHMIIKKLHQECWPKLPYCGAWQSGDDYVNTPFQYTLLLHDYYMIIYLSSFLLLMTTPPLFLWPHPLSWTTPSY